MNGRVHIFLARYSPEIARRHSRAFKTQLSKYLIKEMIDDAHSSITTMLLELHGGYTGRVAQDK